MDMSPEVQLCAKLNPNSLQPNMQKHARFSQLKKKNRSLTQMMPKFSIHRDLTFLKMKLNLDLRTFYLLHVSEKRLLDISSMCFCQLLFFPKL